MTIFKNVKPTGKIGYEMINRLISFFKKGKDIHPSIKTDTSGEQSIVFISLHKCATTFFTNTVFQELQGLKLVDYQSYEYTHEADLSIKPVIHSHGYLYAVLRMYDREHPGYKLTNELLKISNLKKVKTIFWTRDPRDILVSLYFSFGFSHTLSPNSAIQAHQIERREKIQKMDLDTYVLHEAPNLKWKFETMYTLMQQLPEHLFLRYEQMIDDFDPLFEQLSDFTGLDKSLHNKMLMQTRPNETEDVTQHKRSGKTGAYKEKLKPETVEVLNDILSPTLKKFGYVV